MRIDEPMRIMAFAKPMCKYNNINTTTFTIGTPLNKYLAMTFTSGYSNIGRH